MTTARNVLHRGWHFLTRLNVAASLIVIVLLLATLGSCFPQLSAPVAANAERMAPWQAGVQARYGALTGLLAAVGAFRWFRSPPFLICVALLAAATLACILDRWRVVWRRTFRSPAAFSLRAFETAPHTARLAGLVAADMPAVVSRCLQARGFRVRREMSSGSICLRGDRHRLAPLATLATHAGSLLLLLGTLLSSGYGWREELNVEPGATAEVGHGTHLALRNEGFRMMRYPDGSVAAYQAQVTLVEDGGEVLRGSVEVNRPLARHGVGFYLSGYAESGSGYRLALLAVQDAGYGLVIAAGFLVLFGLTVSLYFPRAWIQACLGPDGTPHLAGWAERRAWDFDREFSALVGEIGAERKRGRLEVWKDGSPASVLLGWAAIGAMVVIWGVLSAELVRRGLAAGHWPLTSRYEFALGLAWTVVAVYLLLWVSRRERGAPHEAVGVLAIVFLLGIYALTRAPEQRAAASLLPALRSAWLQVHVLSSMLGYAACGVAAGLGLVRLAWQASSGEDGQAQQIETSIERAVALGFPWLTMGLLSGAIWAQNAWGRYWGWDPKETWAAVAWLWYLLVLHLRPLPGWRGRRLAGLAVAGFTVVLFTVLGVPWLVRVVRLESLHAF